MCTRKDGRQVKPEPIHVVLRHPVTQGIQDEATDDRVVGVEGVAAAAVVVVLSTYEGTMAYDVLGTYVLFRCASSW